MINELYEDTKRKAKKTVEWRMLSLQWKTCSWTEHYDWWWLIFVTPAHLPFINHHHHHHQSILPKGRSFTTNSGTKAAVLFKGRSSTANSGTQVAVLLGMYRYGSFSLLSAPHSLFRIWTNLKRSAKIPGSSTWRWGEWIWLTESSGIHRNSAQVLNISSIRVVDQIIDLEIPMTLRPHL